ncbi:MAG: hypothetical protein OXC62_04265 [Aestuariivita sp.]|nr:hypothetical protein [Aestuariivita sp.]
MTLLFQWDRKRSKRRKLTIRFSSYSVVESLPRVIHIEILADCWEEGNGEYRSPIVSRGRGNGVSALWNNAVAKVMNWDPNWLTELRLLLHDEPHVKALGREDFIEEDYEKRRNLKG